MRTIGPDELKGRFPKLVLGTYERTSKATARYNCVAFANDDDRHWWQAHCHGGRFYWPPNVRHEDSLEAWIELFVSEGYEPTDNREVEADFEKVAIFVDLNDMMPSHVAKSDGRVWKSKLGRGQDIEHSKLDVLEGGECDEYGIVDRIFKRALRRT